MFCLTSFNDLCCAPLEQRQDKGKVHYYEIQKR